ncbi:hypothetical protein H0A36_26420 [Endozoicomonas sp. SM1973]|uniref:ParB/Sulfiredoxin domain-containing protein n=1 Tax=Spartinivicinus marinus TaxID=2994442 RepID=A0A853INW7_9GAMM|nr:hypothetical protein [Spartinivicinus marinus]MCX4030388.1 hypothetical protein [Spartinivicinus marinus]NYZ69556.1 hypothetical protein [Spartinivicinus marinus]
MSGMFRIPSRNSNTDSGTTEKKLSRDELVSKSQELRRDAGPIRMDMIHHNLSNVRALSFTPQQLKSWLKVGASDCVIQKKEGDILFPSFDNLEHKLKFDRFALKKAKSDYEEICALAKTIYLDGISVLPPIKLLDDNSGVYKVIYGQRRFIAAYILEEHLIYAEIEKSTEVYNSPFEVAKIQFKENAGQSDMSLADKLSFVELVNTEYTIKYGKPATVSDLEKETGLSNQNARSFYRVLHSCELVKKLVHKHVITSLKPAVKLHQELKKNPAKVRSELLKKYSEFEGELKECSYFENEEVAQIKSSKRDYGKRTLKMGTTKNSELIKDILKRYSKSKEFSQLKTVIQDLDWNDFEQIEKAWNSFLEIGNTVFSE